MRVSPQSNHLCCTLTHHLMLCALTCNARTTCSSAFRMSSARLRTCRNVMYRAMKLLMVLRTAPRLRLSLSPPIILLRNWAVAAAAPSLITAEGQ